MFSTNHRPVAFCFSPRTKTFVGYGTDSTIISNNNNNNSGFYIVRFCKNTQTRCIYVCRLNQGHSRSEWSHKNIDDDHQMVADFCILFGQFYGRPEYLF